MKNILIGTLLSCIFCTTSVHAQTVPTRSEVFAQLWSQILRPVESTRETPFIDVPETSPHFDLLRYAKRRGIVDDTERFYPNDPAMWADVYIWLMRTRNSYDVDELYRELLNQRITEEPLFHQFEPSATVQNMDDVLRLAAEYDQQLDEEEHEASLYSEKFHGKGTAFGETFDMNALTAAHPRFPHNTLVNVTNVANGKSVMVRINDRGPFVPGRSIDLSLAAFLEIEERSKGVAMVTIERLGDINLVSDTKQVVEIASEESVEQAPESAEGNTATCPILTERYRQRLTRGVYFNRGVPHMLPFGRSLRLVANDYFSIQAITHEGNTLEVVQRFISPNEESYRFTPDYTGTYVFTFRDAQANAKSFSVEVLHCTTSE